MGGYWGNAITCIGSLHMKVEITAGRICLVFNSTLGHDAFSNMVRPRSPRGEKELRSIHSPVDFTGLKQKFPSQDSFLYVSSIRTKRAKGDFLMGTALQGKFHSFKEKCKKPKKLE